MNIAERERLNNLYRQFDALKSMVEELEARLKKLEEKKPVGRPPKNG